MNCDLCENKATVFLTQINDGQMQKVNLCETCSHEKGVTDPTGFALADLLVGVGFEKALPSMSGESSGVACSFCGFTHADFKRVGRMGCPQCYSTFSKDLTGIIKAMHKDTRHVGKAPANLGRLQAVQHRLDELNGSLRTAVADENYESAATLRDEITTLETELEQEQRAIAEGSKVGD